MKLKGNYTVEAAIIVPILIFSMILAIRIGMFLLEEIKNEPPNESINNLWCVQDFYQNQMMKGGVEDDK